MLNRIERGRTVSEVTIGREKMMGAIRYTREITAPSGGGPAVVADPPCRGPVPGPGRRVRTQHTVRSDTWPGRRPADHHRYPCAEWPLRAPRGRDAFTALGWALVTSCALDAVTGLWLWQGRRRPLLGLGSTPFSLALGIGFALPALLLVVPMHGSP